MTAHLATQVHIVLNTKDGKGGESVLAANVTQTPEQYQI